jgi:hypothetical protein
VLSKSARFEEVGRVERIKHRKYLSKSDFLAEGARVRIQFEREHAGATGYCPHRFRLRLRGTRQCSDCRHTVALSFVAPRSFSATTSSAVNRFADLWHYGDAMELAMLGWVVVRTAIFEGFRCGRCLAFRGAHSAMANGPGLDLLIGFAFWIGSMMILASIGAVPGRER